MDLDEDSPPYDHMTILADQKTLDIGNYLMTVCLHDWRKAVASGDYPSDCPDGPVPGGLPEWARRRFDETIELRMEEMT